MVDFAPLLGANNMTRSTLIACALLLSIAAANADTLTPEQQAIVKKYHISAADQKKLFGSAPVVASPAVAAPHYAAPTGKGMVAGVNPYANRTDNWHRGLLNNTYIWAGGETYKSIGERLTNINGGTGSLTGSFGTVGGFNTSFGIDEFPIRVQAGASYGLYDPRGRIALTPHSTERETQTIYTVGLYTRGDALSGDWFRRFSAGVVYDNFRADNWGINANSIDLGQYRGMAGFAVTPWTEVGVSGTVKRGDDMAAVTIAGAPGVLTTIHSMNQRNVYIKQHFDFGGDVTLYYGKLQGIGSWHAGMIAEAPLGYNWAAYANANYVMPHTDPGPLGSGQEQFSAAVGIRYYFGANASAASVSGYKNLPLLPVANNGSFLITD